MYVAALRYFRIDGPEIGRLGSRYPRCYSSMRRFQRTERRRLLCLDAIESLKMEELSTGNMKKRRSAVGRYVDQGSAREVKDLSLQGLTRLLRSS